MEKESERQAMTARAAARSESIPLPWLTVETGAYGLILAAGLLLRLAMLGRWPLLETETNTALAAWRTMRGYAWQPAYYVPLLYDANLLLFWIARATDAAARILPAIAGAGLAMVPYYARDLLGRKAALAASMLLAFAPSWVYFSRTADGAILTAAASAVALHSVHRYLDSQEPRELSVGAVALGLGLTAGPGIYTALVSALALGLVWWLIGDRAERGVRIWALLCRGATRRNLSLLLGTFLLFGSGFLVNPGGIGASLELAGRWVRDLGASSTGLPWSAYLRTLVTYEFLTLALAVLGGFWGLRRRSRLDVYLVGWAGLALVMGTALGHREPVWVLDGLLPLVLLAARGFQRLWDSLAGEASSLEAIVIGVALTVVVFGSLQLARYAHTGQELFLWYARVSLGGLVVAWGAYWVWSKRESALRVGITVVLLVMVVMTVRAATALAYHTGRDPREPMVPHPTSVQVRDLEAMLSTISSRRAGDPRLIDVVYEQGLDPWLAWYLRDYPNARAIPSIGPQPDAMVLVSLGRAQGEWPVGYVGQRFRLRETWTGEGISPRDRLRWLFYRHPAGGIEATGVQVWVRLAAGEQEPG